MATLRGLTEPGSGAGWAAWSAGIRDDLLREANGGVWLDSFQNSGSTLTDDQLLDAAMTNEAAYTHPRTIRFAPRDHSFTTTGRNVYKGFALAGPSDAGLQTWEQGSASTKAFALFNGGSGTSSMFYANTGGSIYTPFNCHDISWRSTNNVSQWLHAPLYNGTTGTNLYGATFGNLQFTGFLYCIGQPNNAATITLSTFWGAWNIPNMAGTPISIRGSDNWIVPDEFNVGWLNGPTAAYIMRCENLQKSFIRGIYFTCNQGTTRALLIDNQNGSGFTQGGLHIEDCIFEGQNNGQPAAGALILINQTGVAFIRHCNINFGMANPTPFTPDDNAYVMANLTTNGVLNIHDISVTRATGVSENVPIISQTGGRVYVNRIIGMPGDTAGQAWTNLPAVTVTGTGTMYIDSTVRVV